MYRIDIEREVEGNRIYLEELLDTTNYHEVYLTGGKMPSYHPIPSSEWVRVKEIQSFSEFQFYKEIIERQNNAR